MTTPKAPIKRPWLLAKPVTWKARDQIRIPGIGLFRRDAMQAHLTPDEARALADRLHDMADRVDSATTSKETN
ncbi:hypothetical protein GU243_02420 [Pseudarthrobacter psychrotolerans]|uniref:Uncharacterized protein n=1 Tax=Pseudarthrobacter psychrotolerans TaxID=2697569 RepID=A0A6P1NHJ8_9MICC|nr:hypothetical protein [Pseudarthrobacter psychrotolerans]QHK18818.1 hypothetical protein GU243_02420 [Pseudarthrobacter psychrotolerans]